MQRSKLKRGKLLQIWLVLMLITNVLTLISMLSVSLFQLLRGNAITPAFIVAGLVSSINIFLAIMIWKWRKWAIYCFGAISAFMFGWNFFYLKKPLYLDLLGLLGIVILVSLLRPSRKNMNEKNGYPAV